MRPFAAQGCQVGFLDLDDEASAALASERSGEVTFEICDLRDVDALRVSLDRLAERLGAASILVNNAARDDQHSWTDVTAGYWAERMHTNLPHMFFANQPVA